MKRRAIGRTGGAVRARASRARRRGAFVVLEGIDGAGTTTQCAALVQRAQQLGVPAIATAQPSAGPTGSLIRLMLKKRVVQNAGEPPNAALMALLFAADRADHVQSEITPALNSGTLVVCDRYTMSSLAYQGIELGMDWVWEVNRHAIAPDLTILVDVDPQVARARRVRRGGPAELFEVNAFQTAVAEQYRRASRFLRNQGQRVARVDGTRSFDVVTNDLWERIQTIVAA